MIVSFGDDATADLYHGRTTSYYAVSSVHNTLVSS